MIGYDATYACEIQVKAPEWSTHKPVTWVVATDWCLHVSANHVLLAL